jgi:hypothetical protein
MIACALSVFFGVVAWTLTEYAIHRWLGHGRRFRKNPFGVEHTRHHALGNYFASAWLKAIASLIVGAGAWGLGGLAVGSAAAGGFVFGLMAMYGAYELHHWLLHVHAGLGPYGRWARRHHFSHHFSDVRKNHGVTSPLWDIAFGTYQRPGRIMVPRKLAMRWLIHPATGEVWPAFRADFGLMGG